MSLGLRLRAIQASGASNSEFWPRFVYYVCITGKDHQVLCPRRSGDGSSSAPMRRLVASQFQPGLERPSD